MSYYTTDVRTICEASLGLTEHVGFDGVDELLTRSAPLIFSFDYPMYDEAYRLTLQKKILRHYFTREIGEETVGLWKLRLCEKLNLIMPYYNQLYRTTLFEFNPLYDVDLTTEHSGSGTSKKAEMSNEKNKNNVTEGGSNTRTQNKEISGMENERNKVHSSGTDSNVNRFSDTPQGAITDLAANRYLTTATLDDGSNTQDSETKRSSVNNGAEKTNETLAFGKTENGNSDRARIGHENITNTEDYTNHVMGTNGNRTYVSKIMEFRKSLLNIDAMIIEELGELFFGLWGV